jgi:hypothetical protein
LAAPAAAVVVADSAADSAALGAQARARAVLPVLALVVLLALAPAVLLARVPVLAVPHLPRAPVVPLLAGLAVRVRRAALAPRVLVPAVLAAERPLSRRSRSAAMARTSTT